MRRRRPRLRLWHLPAGAVSGITSLALIAGATTPSQAACTSAGVAVTVGTPVTGSGAVGVAGAVSTFGPPGEPAGATASANPGGDAVPGISLHIPGTHYSDPRNVALMGHMFRVTINGHTADLPDIDLGPADYLNRAIDVTGAGAAKMGFSPGSFPTDSYGTATLLGPANGLTGGGSIPTAAATNCQPAAPASLQSLVALAQSAIGGPYSVANHATAFNQSADWIKANGTDCSGYISWLLGPRGLNLWSSPLATPAIPTAPHIQAGRGQNVTIWNDPNPGPAGHVWINIAGQYFESAGSTGVHQMDQSEVNRYLGQGRYVPWHPQGL